MGVAKLELDTCDVIYSHFFDVPPKQLLSNQSDGREKNWIPIVSNNKLYILYSDTPRTFIHCMDDKTSLKVEKYDQLNYVVLWNYGYVRGGCPPIEYDKDSLIWFFHSAMNVHSSLPTTGVRTYFIGAYLTTKTYPFPIQKITVYPIFFGTPSPLRKNTSYQTNVVFPCGAVPINDGFLVSMGINDYCIGHLKVYKNDIVWNKFEKKLTNLKLSTVS